MARIDYANKPLTEFVTDIAEGIVIAEGGSVGNNTSIHPGDFQDRIKALQLEKNSSGYRLADASDILNDRVAWGADRQLIKGTIVNQGGHDKELTHDTPSITLQPGYYSGGEISAIVYPNTKYITITPDNPYPNAQAYEEDIDDISGLPRGYLGYPQISVQYSGATYNVNNPVESDSIAGYEFIHVPAGSVSVSGGTLVPTGFTGTPTLTLGKGEDSGALGAFGYSANKPTSDDVYYVPVVANSVEFTGKTKATRSAVTVAQTAGVIEQQNATTVINASTVEPSVTINAGSTTGYITIGKAVRATNDVNIDRYAANDYEYVEIQVSNNQGTGYVTGSNESTRVNIHAKEDTSGNFIVSTEDTANGEQEWYRINKSTASASGKTVTVPAGYIPSQQTVDVATVSRANTTISSLKDSDANTIILTASNNQGTGWVTGANKTASKVVSISANGATVTASDGTNSISKSVATVSRASTTVSATSDDTADTITVTGANNQGTGYVTGANKTASDTITLTQGTPSINTSTGIVTATSSMKDSVSSKSVSQSKTLNLTTKGATTITPTTSEQTAVAAGTYTTGAIKVAAIPGVTRANTTISVSANDTNDTLTVSASNNQSTGYVTGSNKTASTTITLTNSGKTVTATASDGTKISRNVATVTRADNTVNTQWEDYAYADTYGSVPWIQVHNDQGTGYVTGANKTSDIYVLAGANNNGEYEVKTVVGGATETWYTIDKSTASASGKTVTIPAGYVPTEQNVSVSTVSRANTTITSTKDSTANTITLTASNNQGTGWVTGSNKTASKTISLSKSGATVTATDGTNSISSTISNASGSIGGSASSGKATAAISNVNSMNTVTSPTGTAGTDYFTVTATATGTAGGYTPKYTVSTAGYIGSTVTGSKQTVSVSSDTTGKSIHIPKAAFTVSGSSVKTTSTGGGYIPNNTTVGTISAGSYSASGGDLTAGAGSVSASGTNITLTEVSSKPSSGYYITAQGSGSVSRAAITKSASAGYVSAGSSTVSNATSAKSNTATKYYTVSTETKSAMPSTSSQTITPSSGKLLSGVTVAAMPTGEFGDTIIEISDSGTITATTEMLTAGYMSSGAYSTNSLPMTTKGATTYNPSTSTQTIAKGTYLTGDITIAACSDTKKITSTSATTVTGYQYAQVNDDDLKPQNIKKNVSILGVTGTYDPQPSLTTLTASPLWESKTYTTSSYDGYSSVTINAIPSIEFEIVPGNYIEATITDASGTQQGSSLRIPDYVDASIIKSGESIFGVTGTYTGPSYSFGSKTVDPSTSSRTYYASSNGYDGFSSFTVNAMPSGSLSTPSISIDSNGLITATSSVSSSGYLSTSASKSNTQQLTTRDSSDLTASGRTISVPSGYYPDGASKSVSSSYIIPSGGTTIYSNGNNINVKSLEYVNVQVTASPDPKTEETTCWAYGDSTYYGTAYISYEYWSDYYNDWQSDEVSESSPGSGVKATGRNFSVWIVY